MRLATMLLFLAAPTMAASTPVSPEDKPAVREIKAENINSVGRPGRMPAPRKFTTAAEFEKAFSGDGVKEVLKAVDFAKEYIVVFTWGGSGQDRIEYSTEKNEVTFKYTPGRTRDLRGHTKIFVLPSKATFKMGK